MLSNKDKIREACIKVNPEIMELKAGCVVEWVDWVWTCADTIVKGSQLLTSKRRNSVIVENDKLKIIGRPIRLTGVLLALKKELGEISMLNGVSDYILLGHSELTLNSFAKWNLKDDNLENQSEETLQFIADLL